MAAVFKMNLILAGILAFAGWTSAAELEIVYEWYYVDYTWPNETSKEAAIAAGLYDPANIILNDIQRMGDNIFVTTPRYFDNPASLSTVSNQSGDGGPLLAPYPTWDWHTSENCSGITSVSRLALDDCNRLWVVDSGKIGNEQVCDAQLIVFDLETDKPVIRETIPYNLTHNSKNSSQGWLEIQVVKTDGDSCEKKAALIGDPDGTGGIVIYKDGDMWRIENEIFAPNQTVTDFNEDGILSKEWGVSNFVLMPDIFAKGEYVMFGPSLSQDNYVSQLFDLNNDTSNATYYKMDSPLPIMLDSRQVSSSGVLMGGYVGWKCISCWNVGNPIGLPYVVNLSTNPLEQDTFAAKIVKGLDSSKDEYWQISSSVSKFVWSALDITVPNFVISFGYVDDLVNGTYCGKLVNPSDNRTIEDTNFSPYVA